jgi:hypothetical protein
MPKKDSSRGIAGMFYKNSKLQPAGLVLILVLFVAIAWFVRQQVELDAISSDASCYGYDSYCDPWVSIGGRNVNPGYGDNGIYYGVMTVPYGSIIELTWDGGNVNRCEAVGRWTNFKGTYMPPTVFPQKLTASRDFAVKCKAGRETVTAKLSVIVEKPSR